MRALLAFCLAAFCLAMAAGAAMASLARLPPRTCAIDSDCPCGSHCENAQAVYNSCGQIAGYAGGSCVPDCNDLGTECLK